MSDDKKPINYGYPIQYETIVDKESEILEFPKRNKQLCQHIRVRIDTKSTELLCLDCEAKVNPVLWIKDSIEYFKHLQNNAVERQRKLDEDYQELKKRSRTRCQHCTKMTAINLKHHKFHLIG